jgi:hypothetical protein
MIGLIIELVGALVNALKDGKVNREELTSILALVIRGIVKAKGKEITPEVANQVAIGLILAYELLS